MFSCILDDLVMATEAGMCQIKGFCMLIAVIVNIRVQLAPPSFYCTVSTEQVRAKLTSHSLSPTIAEVQVLLFIIFIFIFVFV